MAEEWFGLDLTPAETARVEAMAARHGVSPEELISKLVRQQLALFEHLGARVALGADSVDTRNDA